LINLTIHGHFYQPPRENPWTGEIEEQKSAAPFHDWNEKIYAESYKPNSEAPIIDDTGKIVSITNNYEYLSFNFGPTLLNWIKTKHFDTYQKIIEADRISVERHNGHGNAFAMCYNHVIMPLANERDRITQIRWGLKDFKYHFGRDSEGIWLPETACNMQTIESLIYEGIKFIILDVSQADKMRSIGSADCLDVSNGSINPKYSYLCYSEIYPEKFICIFFYDGPISKSVAFDDVLVSSNNLLNKIEQAINPEIDKDILLSLATDGETFGHHKKLAERTLAYFIKSLVPQNNLNITNFGEYLENHPSMFKVKIKKGDNGEGTSWSCPHGVKRWKEDCGCGKVDNTSQKWRKALRLSLNWLRDDLIEIFEETGSKYFKDPWLARNDYIDLILDNSEKRRTEFLYFHAKRILTKEEIDIFFDLLEMQKYAMLMFSSDGWFFSEISGLETIMILQYAARAIEIGEKLAGKKLEKPFLNILGNAESNLKKYINVKSIWRKLVLPAKQFRRNN
jgi:alpha-amylase/alpha-mannosidase (GH57 family)